jgi:ABC-type molybdate transport system, permease component
VEHHSFHARGLRSEHALHFAIRPRPCLDTRAQTLARKSFGGNSSHIAAGHSARRDRFDSAEAFWPPRSIGAFLFQNFHLDIVFTWRAVVIAASVMSFPLLVRAARVGFESVDVQLEEIALTLGAGPFRTFFTVTLPLAARAISAGIILAFARAIGEFGATILVAGNIPGRTTTISLKIYEAVILGQDVIAWRLVIICLVISFVAIWLSERWSRGAIG